MNQAYLVYVPADALLACGLWDMDNDVDQHAVFFHPRFTVEVPDTLLSKIFSSLMAQLLTSIAKLA